MGLKRIIAVLHVSTAFSNCNRKTIDETFYDPPITGEKLLKLIDCLDDKKLDAITPTLLGDFPNTYAFTKCVAEDVIRTEGKNLPIALYRPSIVIATVKEPVAGWIDNVYGATGILLGVALGLLRTLHGNSKNRADMVPADYVVNSCLAAIWDVATMKYNYGYDDRAHLGLMLLFTKLKQFKNKKAIVEINCDVKIKQVTSSSTCSTHNVEYYLKVRLKKKKIR
ncbi:hypothetical protein NQ318_019442 [Aromia moschata]|uniref:Fatty acyl-CoA reductase n=1 Tax=Aromia moschata TaxID=1265417 RepID=A0AAV8XJK5_9CUCU|nr:hypothetical protein NQ318_019442 [Aromia moschata]